MYYLSQCVVEQKINNQWVISNNENVKPSFWLGFYTFYDYVTAYEYMLKTGFAKELKTYDGYKEHPAFANLDPVFIPNSIKNSPKHCYTFYDEDKDIRVLFVLSPFWSDSFLDYFEDRTNKGLDNGYDFLYVLKNIIDTNNIDPVDKNYLIHIKNIVSTIGEDEFSRFKKLFVPLKYENIPLSPWILVDELKQILEAKSKERALYYVKRLYNSLTLPPKIKGNSNMNLRRWQEYQEIETDSLWIKDRDNSGLHSAAYHGNFIPEIPRQMIKRFTKPGSLVLDVFQGFGTTLIECINLNRNYIGLDINPEAINRCKEIISSSCQDKVKNLTLDIFEQDNLQFDYEDYLVNRTKLQANYYFDLVMIHPPYESIIKFTDKKEDFSNMSPENFRENFATLISKITPYVSKSGIVCLVCSDIYRDIKV
jgi:DNA modification methylase